MIKTKFLKYALPLLLVFALIFPCGVNSSAVQDIAGAKDYAITNPYATVDWNTWKHYRANLHTHSTASDGPLDFDKTIEAYYAEGYDILAMTDHGVVNRGWNTQPQTVPLISYYALFSKPHFLTDARYNEILTGADRGGRGMIDVPFGIEQNAASISLTHVNSFFVDYGQGKWGRENDYETPIAAVDALGGLTHINHPGDRTLAKNDVKNAKDPKNIRYFNNLLVKYPSCLGIEVVNSTDLSTRNDRVFWDCLLEDIIPKGRNIWAFANSDSHSEDSIDSAFEIFMMPDNTIENVRTAMESGTFFACSRNAFNELGEDFIASGEYPTVTSITVDDSTDQITVQGADYDTVQWISKGEIIATGNTIDLNEHEDRIGRYVRAQLKGRGGICFTQAFVTDDGSPAPEEPVIPLYIELWDKLVLAFTGIRVVALIRYLIYRT